MSDRPNDIETFKIDAAKFSGNYEEFLVIVKTRDGAFLWKATDPTWAIGAARRYLTCADEVDRLEERAQIMEDL